MAPKRASRVEPIDGVDVWVDKTGKKVVVGSKLLSNEERDSFTLTQNGGTLEEQVRARPKFAGLAALAEHAARAHAESSEGLGGVGLPQDAAPVLEKQAASSSSSAAVEGDSGRDADTEPDLFSGLGVTMAGVESAGGETGIRRSSRKRSATQMLDPAAELPHGELSRLRGDRATGQRWALAEKGWHTLALEQECRRPDCVATLAENAQLRQKLEAETSRHAFEPAPSLQWYSTLASLHSP